MNARWIGILVSTALLAGVAGFAIGGVGSEASMLTGDAYAGRRKACSVDCRS